MVLNHLGRLDHPTQEVGPVEAGHPAHPSAPYLQTMPRRARGGGSATASTARHRLQVWCRWVRWVARFYRANLLGGMVKAAQMVENHFAGIVAHWKFGLTNAFMEGLNSVFSATKRKARGFSSPVYLITVLYLVAGKLS